jgi:hypothetical protein
MDAYWLQCLSVFLLSLWKTYLGPALSAPYGFSYAEMLFYNVGAALLSASITLHFSRDVNALISRLLPKRTKKPGFRPELRKYVRFWRRYGFYGVMALTPVLIGIPLGAWIAARLGTHKASILLALFICSVLWSTVLYHAAQVGITFI